MEIHVILLKVSLLKVRYVYNKPLQKSHVKVKKAMQIQNQIKYKWVKAFRYFRIGEEENKELEKNIFKAVLQMI